MRFALTIPVLCILCSPVSLYPVTAMQRVPELPEAVRRELSGNYFMDEALDLLLDQPSPEAARARIEAAPHPVQFMGSQARDNEITNGYVSRFPETFVSVTLFFDRTPGSLETVHVVMSPGMWSRALAFIEGAVDPDGADSLSFGDRAYLLGAEPVGDREVRVFVTEQESELGTIYAINYTVDAGDR